MLYIILLNQDMFYYVIYIFFKFQTKLRDLIFIKQAVSIIKRKSLVGWNKTHNIYKIIATQSNKKFTLESVFQIFLHHFGMFKLKL